MSAYENVVAGKLRLKGKALNVKSSGIKKKKKHNNQYDLVSQVTAVVFVATFFVGLVGLIFDVRTLHQFDCSCEGAGGSNALTADQLEDDLDNSYFDSGRKEQATKNDDHLTPAERKYLEQWEKLNIKRLSKEASKSHRDRIQEFNQYLANLTEHYDIPKVGPG